MAIPDYKITESDLSGKGNIGQPDVPGLSASEMQAKLDELSREVIIPKYNELCDALATFSLERTVHSQEVSDLRLDADNTLEFSRDGGESWIAPRQNGHVILAADGTDAVQRSRMRFKNGEVSDDGSTTEIGFTSFAQAEHTRSADGVHLLVRQSDDPAFRFVATADCLPGDSFRVDGETVTLSGQQPTFRAGDDVMALCRGGALSFWGMRLPAPNLLDNGNLADPINQRGQTQYTAHNSSVYTFDRWVLEGIGIAELTSEGIRITAGEAGADFYQRIPLSRAGRALTLSASAEGQIPCMTGFFTQQTDAEQEGAPLSWGSLLLAYDADDAFYCAGVRIKPGCSVTLRWVKLEDGNTATPFLAREKTVEQDACWRWLCVVPNNMYVFGFTDTNRAYNAIIDLPRPMAAVPSYTGFEATYVAGGAIETGIRPLIYLGCTLTHLNCISEHNAGNVVSHAAGIIINEQTIVSCEL